MGPQCRTVAKTIRGDVWARLRPRTPSRITERCATSAAVARSHRRAAALLEDGGALWRWRAHARAGAHAGSWLGGRGMRQPVGRAWKLSHSRVMDFRPDGGFPKYFADALHIRYVDHRTPYFRAPQKTKKCPRRLLRRVHFCRGISIDSHPLTKVGWSKQ